MTSTRSRPAPTSAASRRRSGYNVLGEQVTLTDPDGHMVDDHSR